jgi:hypothetical protein
MVKTNNLLDTNWDGEKEGICYVKMVYKKMQTPKENFTRNIL